MNLSFKIITLFTVFLGFNLYSQDGYFTYNQIRVSESINIEREFNSIEFVSKVKTAYSSGSNDLEQPKQYRRPRQNDFPSATVSYYYTKQDSLIKSISYHWNVYVPVTFSEANKIKRYNSEYDRLIKLISSFIGQPKPNQGKIVKGKETLIGDGQTDNYQRSVTWDYKNCNVETVLIWAENHGESFMTRIYWKK